MGFTIITICPQVEHLSKLKDKVVYINKFFKNRKQNFHHSVIISGTQASKFKTPLEERV